MINSGQMMNQPWPYLAQVTTSTAAWLIYWVEHGVLGSTSIVTIEVGVSQSRLFTGGGGVVGVA